MYLVMVVIDVLFRRGYFTPIKRNTFEIYHLAACQMILKLSIDAKLFIFFVSKTDLRRSTEALNWDTCLPNIISTGGLDSWRLKSYLPMNERRGERYFCDQMLRTAGGSVLGDDRDVISFDGVISIPPPRPAWASLVPQVRSLSIDISFSLFRFIDIRVQSSLSFSRY